MPTAAGLRSKKDFFIVVGSDINFSISVFVTGKICFDSLSSAAHKLHNFRIYPLNFVLNQSSLQNWNDQLFHHIV